MASHSTCFALALAVAVGTPAVVFAQTDDTSQPWTANWSVVNNTTTPDVRPDVPVEQRRDGGLSVGCGGKAFYVLDSGSTVAVPCPIAAGASASLRYMTYIGNNQFVDRTVAWDCQKTETLTATFAGSGESITVQTVCSGGDVSDASDDSSSDDDSSDNSGDSITDGGGSGSGSGGGSGSGDGGS